MSKIKKGDEVIVITGKDKGRRGSVLRVMADGRALVDSINIVKRHTKPNPQAGTTGGIVEQEAPIQISNLAIFNPSTGKGDRVGFRVSDDGSKSRVFKSNGEVIE
ncbi:50S ribosomal protein L24 [Gammaproteobacteria bacterium]|nr:50S ribosomal protein L24 [Gammaproteobacteria bacterium]